MAFKACVNAFKHSPCEREVSLCEQKLPQAADLLLTQPWPQAGAALTQAQESIAATDLHIVQASFQVQLQPAPRTKAPEIITTRSTTTAEVL
jgi:hypothetical protein